jgi:hypothetical protein
VETDCFLKHVADGSLVGRNKQPIVVVLPGLRPDAQRACHAL